MFAERRFYVWNVIAPILGSNNPTMFVEHNANLPLSVISLEVRNYARLKHSTHCAEDISICAGLLSLKLEPIRYLAKYYTVITLISGNGIIMLTPLFNRR